MHWQRYTDKRWRLWNKGTGRYGRLVLAWAVKTRDGWQVEDRTGIMHVPFATKRTLVLAKTSAENLYRDYEATP